MYFNFTELDSISNYYIYYYADFNSFMHFKTYISDVVDTILEIYTGIKKMHKK
jgi:hypothetical protein